MAGIQEIVVDCRDPASIAGFWAAALDGYQIAPYDEAELQRLRGLGVADPRDDPTVRVVAPPGQPGLFFQRVPEPRTGKNRLHLDLRCAGFEAEIERLTALGARVLAEYDTFTVLGDPEGNEFCLSRRTAPDLGDPLADRSIRVSRRLGLAFLTGCCLVLIPWIILLAVTLPQHYRAADWGVAWTGLDIAELLAFGATALASLLRRQVMVPLMLVTATLLCCDAWFDVTLSWGSSEAAASVAEALLIELPIAVLMVAGARRITDRTVRALMRRAGMQGPRPPLWRLRLIDVIGWD